MKHYRIASLLLVFFFALLTPACKTKSGCEATESLRPQTSKKGGFKAGKKRDAGLFPKKMSKKMNR